MRNLLGNLFERWTENEMRVTVVCALLSAVSLALSLTGTFSGVLPADALQLGGDGAAHLPGRPRAQVGRERAGGGRVGLGWKGRNIFGSQIISTDAACCRVSVMAM